MAFRIPHHLTLLSILCLPAAALRLQNDSALPGGAEDCAARTSMLQEAPAEQNATRRRPPSVNGTPWCAGTVRAGYLNNTVAVVLVGQPYRAKNFENKSSAMCTAGTDMSQSLVAKSHVENVIEPLEALGFKVEVFLSNAPCEWEVLRHEYKKSPTPAFTPLTTLRRMYGLKRIRSVHAPLESKHSNMYSKLGDSFLHVNKVMERLGGLYEYFTFIRFDVQVERKLTELMPSPPSPLHHGMTFFQTAHDFMWSFPGELWGCWLKFWTECMNVVGPYGLQSVGLDRRRSLGCFDFGPLQLDEWHAGYGYNVALDAILRKIKGSHELQPRIELRRTGTSVWNEEGQERRCENDGFFPPRSAVEPRFMPTCFHVG